MTNLAIAANGLRKSYGDTVVLDGVDLAVPSVHILCTEVAELPLTTPWD